MPIQRELYPDNWEEIALKVKTDADWKCQNCGRQCRRPGEPFDTHKNTLTVAHLNHDPADCRTENLKALCAGCHLRYDAKHHAKTRKRKANKMGTLTREERQNIIALAEAGESVKRIREITGRSREAVVAELGRAGIDGNEVDKKAYDVAERNYDKAQWGESYDKRKWFRDLPYSERMALAMEARKEIVKGCKAYRDMLMSDYKNGKDAEVALADTDDALEDEIRRLREENEHLRALLKNYLNTDDIPAAGLVENKDVNSMPLTCLCIEPRTYNCLARAGINTIGDILNNYNWHTIKSIRNFGNGARDDLDKALNEIGVELTGKKHRSGK